MTAQQTVWIVQKRLRNGAGGNKAAEILWNSCRFWVAGGLAWELDLGVSGAVVKGVMSTGFIVGGPATVAMMPWASIVVPCGMDAKRATVSWVIGGTVVAGT